MVTIEAIAGKAGVSKATVSRVLNGAQNVSETTRRNVLLIANELGYVARRSNASEDTGVTYNLGALFPINPDSIPPKSLPADEKWDTNVIHALERHVRGCGFNIFVSHVDMISSDSPMPSFVTRRQVDGLFVVGGLFSEEWIRRLNATRLPVIVVGSYSNNPKTTAVYSDYYRGAFLGTSHLLTMGHRSVALVNGPGHTHTSEDKFFGYLAALRAHGLSLDEDLVQVGKFNQTSGFEAAAELFANGKKFSAVFVANSSMAIGLMQWAKENGVSIPHDLAVVAHHDEPVSSIVRPALSAIALHSERLGVEAARRMIGVLEQKETTGAKVMLPVDLIVRESCGAK